MIQIQNIDFSYGERPILKNVSFEVNDNESIVIMGPSGSGKSTILRLILGLECPHNGKILLDGKNICTMKEREKEDVRKEIGMVFQDGALFDSLSIWENVGFYLLEHTNLSMKEIGQRAIEMLGFVGLNPDEIMYKLPEHLSGGMQRRVAIGRALLSTNPKVMLYDEPTTGLDPQSTENVLNLINKLHQERHISTIAVTHQIADAVTLADRFVVIYEGEVVFDGNTEELRTSQDKYLLEFLKPFRASFEKVLERKFINNL